MERLIGREREQKELWRCYESTRSEFVVVYGRRRVGKTFLISQTFKDKFSFYFTGSHQSSKERQLELFAKSLQQFGKLSLPPHIDNWHHAFDALEIMLQDKKNKGKKILFFDEMPWIDTYRSEFVAALEDFWNTWAALRDDIFLIASGSATSWMVNNLVDNQGGLHNRITSSISLNPFTLYECEQYLRSHECPWDRYTITQCYMYLGGIPFYYSLLDYKASLGSNIDSLFFQKKSKLMNEFFDLYNVLFKGADRYITLVRLLAKKRSGMTRNELAVAMGSDGGGLTRMLDNLENCDFITSYAQFGNKRKGSLYKLTDFYSLFYLKFVEGISQRNDPYWQRRMNEPDVLSWQGLTFELVGLMHIEQIKQRLGISGIFADASSWRSTQAGNQIDLVIDRSDRNINLCEMKFSTEPFVITKEYEQRLPLRMADFREGTKTRKTLLTTFVTTYGVVQNSHAGIVQAEVLLDDLFASPQLT